jgi:hypothetical protein
MPVESGSSPIKKSHPVSTHEMPPLQMRPHHDSRCWIVNIQTTPIEELSILTIKHFFFHKVQTTQSYLARRHDVMFYHAVRGVCP